MHITKNPGRRRWIAAVLGAASLIAGALVASGVGIGAASAAPNGPCDIYNSAGTPCVAAYSTTRVLKANYTGALYQVRRSDGATSNIGALSSGYANAAAQDSFCGASSCLISLIYDQSGNGNTLPLSPDGDAGTGNMLANAKALPITINGNKAYGVYLPPKTAYRLSSTSARGTARGQTAESMYEVASGTNVNNGCCSDFGNVETLTKDDGKGTMDTINLSLLNGANGSNGFGPWVQNDLENGVWQGQSAVNTANRGNASKFVTAMTKNNGTNTFALKGGNAQSGALSTWWEGGLPTAKDGDGRGYYPMRLEGSIELGAGGDNSNRGTQSFFEGIMTTGYSSTATDNAIQQNVVAQNYQGVSTGGGPGYQIRLGANTNKCVDVDGDDTGGNLAKVQVYDCLSLAADQNWVGDAHGVNTLGTLGRCLDIANNGTTDGAKLELYDCNGVGGQKWLPRGDGSLFNPQSGKCLDVPSGNTANGTQLQLYTCNGSTAQQFNLFTPIHLNDRTRCLDIAGDDIVDGATHPAQVYDCRTIFTDQPEAKDQQWTYDRGTQRIVNAIGRCLDVNQGGTTNGTPVQSYTCIGGGAQQWQLQSNGSIRNPNSGLCLDDPSGNVANETHLQLYTCNGATAQVFRFNG